MAEDNPVKSPCIGVCALDAADRCVACGRSGLEIAEWGVMTDTEKRAVLERIEKCCREEGRYD